jgi:hypothetical protein
LIRTATARHKGFAFSGDDRGSTRTKIKAVSTKKTAKKIESKRLFEEIKEGEEEYDIPTK